LEQQHITKDYHGLIWQIVPDTRSGNFEYCTGERTARAAFEHQAYWAQMSPSTFSMVVKICVRVSFVFDIL